MRFSTAWARVAAQNVTLKVATVILSIVSIVQLVIIGGLASRSLPVIERSCFSRALTTKGVDPTKDEIRSFLREALPMRFDSGAYIKDGFLSIQEATLREKEQAALKQRQIIQKIVVSEINIEGNDINVAADRMIAVAKIKSVLTLNLKATIMQTNRTESNPYGLVLSSVTQIEEKEEK